MIRDFFKNGLVNHDFPVLVNAVVYNGHKTNTNGVCTVDCYEAQYGSALQSKTCSHGFTHYLKKVNGIDIAIIDVISDNGKLARKYRGRNVNLAYAERWFKYISIFESQLENLVYKKASEDFDKFHEVTKWCDQIHHYSDKILRGYGSSPKEAEGNAPKSVRSLYKSSVMLKDSLETTGIYFNPNAARYGRKRSTDVYRMVDKIVRVVEHSEASAFNKKIKLRGRVEKNYDIYESFKIIPMSFLQNAIKYSSSDEVKVKFEEFANTLLISVISSGNYITDEELVCLFDRGFRTPWARKIHHDGKGLGLFVSKIVADAHGFKIGAKSTRLNYEYNGSPQAENVFFLKLTVK